MAASPGSLAHFIGFCRRHRLVLGMLSAAGLAAGLVTAFAIPVQYTAHAVLLPQPEESGGLLGAAASLAGNALPLAGLASLTQSETQVNEAVVRSRRTAEAVHAVYDLDARYHADSPEERLEAWHRHLGTRTTRQGLLEITVRDRDPQDAAAITGRVLQELDLFNREIRTTRSRRIREFIEARLQEVTARMTVLEDRLTAYQETHSSLALSPTSEAVVTAGAEVLAERMRLGSELRLLERTLSSSAPVVREKQARLDALDEELSRLPQVGTELGRLLREMHVVERTYGYLTAQLEDARLDEARDTPTIDVLDPPEIPVERTWPPRTWIVLSALAAGILTGLAAAKVADAYRESTRWTEAGGA